MNNINNLNHVHQLNLDTIQVDGVEDMDTHEGICKKVSILLTNFIFAIKKKINKFFL